MGGLLSSLFGAGAIGGSSAKSDRKDYIDAAGKLDSVFNWALPFGKAAAATGQKGVAAGQGDLGTAAGYLKTLTSGSRPDLMQAIAPEASAVTSAADAGKRELAATGTARGGGVAGTNQDIKAKTDAAIDAALFGVRPQAAGELAKVGSAEGELGLGETGMGLNAAKLGEAATAERADLARLSRTDSQKIHQDAVDSITKGIDETLSSIMGAL